MDLTKSSFFKHAVKVSFSKVDKDKSGAINPHELTLGLALLYFKLSQKVPGIADPPSLEEVENYFKSFDRNKSGDLDLEEYGEFCESWVKTKGVNLTGALITGVAIQALLLPEIANQIHINTKGTILEHVPKKVLMIGVVLISKFVFKEFASAGFGIFKSKSSDDDYDEA
mmetsp:Transcript_24336/g.24600  ORF Transcript_24336/g.24600 Transcript_24336/m.24600 type:complete len:170 (+) Transcript_24336:41-550(+)